MWHRAVIPTGAVLVALASLVVAVFSLPASAGGSDLQGLWFLMRIEGAAIRGRDDVTLDIRGSAFQLYAGCNQIGGSIRRRGERGQIRFIEGQSTMMACPGGYEHALLRLVVDVRRFHTDGYSLRLFSKGNSVLIFAKQKSALEGRQGADGDIPVVGSVSINGGRVPRADQPRQTLQFGDGGVTGESGCGRYGPATT